MEMIPYIMKLSLRLINYCTVDTVRFAGKAILLNAKMYAILSKISAYWPYQSLATFVAKLVHIMPQLTNKKTVSVQ